MLAALSAAAFAAWDATASHARQRQGIPERLADTTFWRIVSTFSEPSGYFSSENFVSNETEWQYVIPAALKRVNPAGAYLGVGPEQNFTYIAAFRPRIAFITDIRRQNLVQHLMYKALIELSDDRAGFLAMLWSRPRPAALGAASTPAELVNAYRGIAPDSAYHARNVAAVFDQLGRVHGFALSADDSATLRSVYRVFYMAGPDISYSSSSAMRGAPRPPVTITGSGVPVAVSRTIATVMMDSSGTMTARTIVIDTTGRTRVLRDSAGTLVPDTPVGPVFTGVSFGPMYGGGYATFGSLMTEDDGTGTNRGWLGSEAAFQWLRDFQRRNLVVPVVGDFAGEKALRSVAEYLRAHDARVSAFYTSNVEQYLFRNRVDAKFYENVAALPFDSSGIFIRSFPNNVAGSPGPRRAGSRLAQTTSSIEAVVAAYRAGLIAGYGDLARLQDRPPY